MNKFDQELQVAFETYQASQSPNLTYEQLKNHLDDNEIFLEERYPESSRRAEDFEVYKAAWQEQQKKIDAVQAVVANLQEELKGFTEVDLYDKGYRRATQSIKCELEKALQGDTNA